MTDAGAAPRRALTALLLGLLGACGEALPQRNPTTAAATRAPGVGARSPGTPAAAESAHWPALSNGRISVRLVESTTAPAVACDGAWIAVDIQGRERARGTALALTPRLAEGRLQLGAQDLGPLPVALTPADGARISVAGREYRGELRFEEHGGRLAVLCGVDLEDYLLGVVPAEMPDRFGLEALKAQAIAARSYALAEVQAGRTLHGDVRSQAYGGRSAETALSTRAVRETSGQVLLSGAQVVKAFYHSTCGGKTEPAAVLFPDATPGTLTAVVDCPDCRDSGWRDWTRSFPAERVCAAVGLPAAPLQSVSVSPAILPGRPSRIHVQAGGRTAALALPDFRMAVSVGLPFSAALPSTFLAHAPQVVQGELQLVGHGWGHGVGLCQYGAAGFTRRGADARSILARYYPGCTIGPLP